MVIENKFSYHTRHSLRYHAKKRPKQNKCLVCLGRTNLMSVVPPSFMENKFYCFTMLSDSRNGGYRRLLLKYVCSKPKLQGAFPPHFGKIFTIHLLSKPSCVCTTPLHSHLTMGQLYLRFLKLSTANNHFPRISPAFLPISFCVPHAYLKTGP